MSGRRPGLLPHYADHLFVGFRGNFVQVKHIIALPARGSHGFSTVFEGCCACTAGFVLVLWTDQRFHWLTTWRNPKVLVWG